MELKNITESNTEIEFISQDEVLKIIDSLSLDTSIDFSDIPNLDLYMDQVITLFEEKLSHTKRYDEDKLLTKTMINNYAKDRLLMPAKKKKYTREHILLMIILYELKQILSIGDIKELFNIVVKDGEVDTKKLEIIYEIYLSLRQGGITTFKEDVKTITADIEDKVSRVFAKEFNKNYSAMKLDEVLTGEYSEAQSIDKAANINDEGEVEEKQIKTQEEDKEQNNNDVDELSKMYDMLTVVTLIQRANYYKRLAEKIIDDKLKN